MPPSRCIVCFFFNDTATTEIYTLSLHDALPISNWRARSAWCINASPPTPFPRSEEHTSELQSPCNLVCRLLLEKKNMHIEHHSGSEPAGVFGGRGAPLWVG